MDHKRILEERYGRGDPRVARELKRHNDQIAIEESARKARRALKHVPDSLSDEKEAFKNPPVIYFRGGGRAAAQTVSTEISADRVVGPSIRELKRQHATAKTSKDRDALISALQKAAEEARKNIVPEQSQKILKNIYDLNEGKDTEDERLLYMKSFEDLISEYDKLHPSKREEYLKKKAGDVDKFVEDVALPWNADYVFRASIYSSRPVKELDYSKSLFEFRSGTILDRVAKTASRENIVDADPEKGYQTFITAGDIPHIGMRKELESRIKKKPEDGEADILDELRKYPQVLAFPEVAIGNPRAISFSLNSFGKKIFKEEGLPRVEHSSQKTMAEYALGDTYKDVYENADYGDRASFLNQIIKRSPRMIEMVRRAIGTEDSPAGKINIKGDDSPSSQTVFGGRTSKAGPGTAQNVLSTYRAMQAIAKTAWHYEESKEFAKTLQSEALKGRLMEITSMLKDAQIARALSQQKPSGLAIEDKPAEVGGFRELSDVVGMVEKNKATDQGHMPTSAGSFDYYKGFFRRRV